MTKLERPVKRTARASDVPHGVRQNLVVTLIPGGTIGLREQGRRFTVTCGLGWLYAELVRRQVAATKREKKRRRNGARTSGATPRSVCGGGPGR